MTERERTMLFEMDSQPRPGENNAQLSTNEGEQAQNRGPVPPELICDLTAAVAASAMKLLAVSLLSTPLRTSSCALAKLAPVLL